MRDLQLSSVRGRLSFVLLLIVLLTAASAQVGVPSQSRLRAAARTGNLAVLRSELEHGANPNGRDAKGRTPLFDAVAAGQVGAMRVLISAGASVKVRSGSGETPLIEAAADGQTAAAKLLISQGADLNFNSRGWGTAMKAAERAGHNEIAAMLRAAGARSTGSSLGDKVCVRPWDGNGYCGVVQSIDKNQYTLRVTQIVGCTNGCTARPQCSAGRLVGGADGLRPGDSITTVSWCLTDTGVK